MTDLFTISMKEYEKALMIEFFQAHDDLKEIYMLYLLMNNKIIEASKLRNKIDISLLKNPTILAILEYKCEELPELIKNTLKQKYPSAYRVQNSIEIEDDFEEKIPRSRISAVYY